MFFGKKKEHLWRGLHHDSVQRKERHVEGDFKSIRYKCERGEISWGREECACYRYRSDILRYMFHLYT